MLLTLIILSTIAAITADIYIYKRLVARYNIPRAVKVLYIVSAAVLDTLVLFALVRIKFADVYSPAFMRSIMWSFAVFFLSLMPKVVYAFVSLLDYPLEWIRKKRSNLFGWIGLVAAVFVAETIFNGMTYGRSEFRVETVDLAFDNLPESFDGLRVVQFSDLHIGNIMNRDKFISRMVETINSLEPDIVVQNGDLVNMLSDELDDKVIGILSGIRARHGVYSVLGNHDLGIYVRDTARYPIRENARNVKMKQRQMGWTVLRNETVYIKDGADSIAVTGLDYPFDKRLNSSHLTHLPDEDVEGVFASVPGSVFNIAISHAPQLWDKILEQDKAELTLAGHIHAMQMKLCGGRWSPARFMYDRWSGLYEQDGRYLYINDGLGYVMFPIRIGTRPEITIFTIRSK